VAFKDVLKTVYPFIHAAASLGGPFGAMAAQAVAKVIGVDQVEPTPDGINAAITQAQASDPTVLLKLKQAEQDFALQMQQLGIKQVDDLLQMDATDRANARAREVAVKDKTPMILAFVVVAMTIVAEGYAMQTGAPLVDKVVLGRILGTLDSALMLTLSYYFGSSSGSAAKTAILAEAATHNAIK